MIKRICAICGKEFLAESSSRKYCSRECRAIGAGKPITGVSRWGRSYSQVCVYCGRTFDSGSPKGRFCSKYCKDRYEREQRRREKELLKKNSINEIVKEATKQGMSYGQYVAKMERGD